MRVFLSLALLVSLVALTARADANPASPPSSLTQQIRAKPSQKEIFFAFLKTGLRTLTTSVTVAYDEQGNVTGVKMDKPTGYKALDNEIMAWAAKLKIETKEAGLTYIPLSMNAG